MFTILKNLITLTYLIAFYDYYSAVMCNETNFHQGASICDFRDFESLSRDINGENATGITGLVFLLGFFVIFFN